MIDPVLVVAIDPVMSEEKGLPVPNDFGLATSILLFFYLIKPNTYRDCRHVTCTFSARSRNPLCVVGSSDGVGIHTPGAVPVEDTVVRREIAVSAKKCRKEVHLDSEHSMVRTGD